MRDNSADYRRIFLNDVPMMDVRAPVEFTKGAFPGVVNLPLMNDIERQKVGTCYKQQGQQAAIELGHKLVSGPTKAERVEAWAAFARAHPDGFLYCFRGGLRSQIVQQWLASEAGIAYPRVTGGYKAMRTFLLDTTQQAMAQCDVVVVGGLTGTGKTELISQVANSLDLEGHANHRGSSFGGRPAGQPAQIDFENRLAIDILKKRAAGIAQFVLEDEGRHIGSCSVPHEVQLRIQHAPIVWLEEAFEARVERILRDYVVDLCAEYRLALGDEAGFDRFSAQLQQNLANIARRLGGERYQRLLAIMQRALQAQRNKGPADLHREWIVVLLQEYYDPMYAFQRDTKTIRVEFAGDQAAVLDYLRQRQPCSAVSPVPCKPAP